MTTLRYTPLAPTSTTTVAIDAAQVLAHARTVVEAEGKAVLQLAACLGPGFVESIALLQACEGRIVVTGMGKSGLVGQKISATLASTGAPSLFMHAAEAIHGDLGRITAADVVLALSNSGESEELVRLVRPVRALGAKLIAITARTESSLSRHADAVIALGDIAEACPMGLVPTASTTVMMVVGDALAMCLFNSRGFGESTYARLHPGGTLGRKLMKVRDVMREGAANPVAQDSASLRQVLEIMTQSPGRPGATSVVDVQGRLIGFFTDGDLRRLLKRPDFAIDANITQVMHRNPKHVEPDTQVVEAIKILRTYKIDQVPVVDASGAPIGLLDVQDVLSARFP